MLFLRPRAAATAIAIAAATCASGCHSATARAANNAPSAARSDSITGIVRITGSLPLEQVVLIIDNASLAVSLDGPPSLRKVVGLRVAVTGNRNGARFTVERFSVISAGGVAATDGILASEGGAIALITADGKHHTLVNPPLAFRQNIGHRVWFAGPLDREPVSYGVIE